MKKIIALALLLAALPLVKVWADHDRVQAQNYLKNHQPSAWGTMALSAVGDTTGSSEHLKNVSGTSAIDYAAPILALTALGENPRTFGASDYVAALKSYYTGGQIGDASTLNDDFFGLLALVSAGEDVSGPIIATDKDYILTHQNNDGGWGFMTTGSSDTNMTAAAILALLAAHTPSTDSHIQSALLYLRNSQNNDGGFPYIFPGDSDSASTAWVIWALNAGSIDARTWSQTTNNPISYLDGNQDARGFFKYQTNSSEDSFSPVTTSYALIALEGKTLPLNIVSANNPAQKYAFRIEGSTRTICEGQVAGPTALDIVKNAQGLCGYTYQIQDTSYGPYLKRINEDEAQGLTGWMYLVNFISPPVGANDYELQNNDQVLWYYGDYGWPPSKLTIDSSQKPALALVEYYLDNSWQALSQATVHLGSQTFASNDQGRATLTGLDGYYQVYATKSSYIRSNKAALKIGEPPRQSLGLKLIVEAPDPGAPPDTIGFSLDTDSLNFDSLKPGRTIHKNVVFNNTGNVDLRSEAITTGDDIFVNNTKLNGSLWRDFSARVPHGQSQNIAVQVSVPSDYNDSWGEKNGQLTFWVYAP